MGVLLLPKVEAFLRPVWSHPCYVRCCCTVADPGRPDPHFDQKKTVVGKQQPSLKSKHDSVRFAILRWHLFDVDDRFRRPVHLPSSVSWCRVALSNIVSHQSNSRSVNRRIAPAADPQMRTHLPQPPPITVRALQHVVRRPAAFRLPAYCGAQPSLVATSYRDCEREDAWVVPAVGSADEIGGWQMWATAWRCGMGIDGHRNIALVS